MDLNSLQFDDVLPTRFVISEGTLDAPFILVDDRAGTPLHESVTRLVNEVRARIDHGGDAIEILRTFISESIGPAPENWRFGLPADWKPVTPPEYKLAANKPVGHYPLATQLSQPLIDLDAYLQEGHSLCLEKTLFTALILRRLGIPHRIRVGGTEVAGHNWIELPDGRHLDPTWNVVAPVDTEGARVGWFHFDRSYLYQDQVFPIAVDPETTSR